MEQHGGNISNALSTCADLKQICQVPLAFLEKWCLSMFLANPLDEKGRIYLVHLNFDDAEGEPDSLRCK